MTKLRTALLGAAALGALALGTQAANATFYVFYSTDGGSSYTQLSSGPDGTLVSNAPLNVGGVSITQSSFFNNAPNANNGAIPSFVNNSQLAATSSNGGAVRFAVVDNAFQGPTPPDQLSNGITLDQNGNIAGSTLSAFSCVANSSAAVTTTTVGSLCTGAATTSTASLTTSATAGSTANQSTFATVAALNTPFTIAEFFSLNLVAGANVNAQGNATLTKLAVPEPVSLSLLSVGLIGLGLAGRRRKG